MTTSTQVGSGVVYPKLGYAQGRNNSGDLISGSRTAPGQWSLTNQNNGTQFDVDVNSVGSGRNIAYLDVTRTTPDGVTTTNDLTLLGGSGHRVGVYDFNQSGWTA